MEGMKGSLNIHNYIQTKSLFTFELDIIDAFTNVEFNLDQNAHVKIAEI